jgi:hypothetical protein
MATNNELTGTSILDEGIDAGPIKKPYVTSDGVDTAKLLNKEIYAGIQGKPDDQKADAMTNPDNYVTTLTFPLPSVDKKGDVVTSYPENKNDKNSKTLEGHNNIKVGIKLNIATYTNLDKNFKDVRKENVGMFSTPARVHVPEGETKGRVALGGKTQFDLDLATIAKESNEDRLKALKSKGITPSARLTAKDADKRIDITTKEAVIAKDGVGAVSAETLTTTLTQVAATSYFLQNSKDCKDKNGEKKAERGAFDKGEVAAAGKIIAGSYAKAMAEVADAVNNNKPLADLAAKDKKTGKPTKDGIAGTGFEPNNGSYGFELKPVSLGGSQAYAIKFTGDPADAKKSLNEVMKAAGNRINKTLTQDVNALAAGAKGLDKDGATYQLASASKFSLAPVNVKTSDGKQSGVTVVSPRMSAQFSPYADKVTTLNQSMKDPTPGAAAKILGEESINRVAGMAKAALKDVPQRDTKAYEAAHDQAIKDVQDALSDKGGKAKGKGVSK